MKLFLCYFFLLVRGGRGVLGVSLPFGDQQKREEKGTVRGEKLRVKCTISIYM